MIRTKNLIYGEDVLKLLLQLFALTTGFLGPVYLSQMRSNGPNSLPNVLYKKTRHRSIDYLCVPIHHICLLHRSTKFVYIYINAIEHTENFVRSCNKEQNWCQNWSQKNAVQNIATPERHPLDPVPQKESTRDIYKRKSGKNEKEQKNVVSMSICCSISIDMLFFSCCCLMYDHQVACLRYMIIKYHDHLISGTDNNNNDDNNYPYK